MQPVVATAPLGSRTASGRMWEGREELQAAVLCAKGVGRILEGIIMLIGLEAVISEFGL
jgi:hypothetical protein